MNIFITVTLAIIEPLALLVLLILYVRHYNKRHPIRAATRSRAVRTDVPGWLYEIADPDTRVAVYVGQSAEVERRIQQYIRAALSTGLLYAWIAEKLQQGKKPLVRLLDQAANKDELARLEEERIAMHLNAGVKLFNRQITQPSAWINQYVNIEVYPKKQPEQLAEN